MALLRRETLVNFGTAHSDENRHLQGSHRMGMPSVREPFALINITTGPCEHTIATHVTHLPLPIIRLCLILFRVDSRLDFSLKKTLSMILTLLPIAAVASKAPFENQHAESFSLTLLEIS